MTPDELAAIKARAEAATPGPWRWDEVGEEVVGPDGQSVPTHLEANTSLIIHSRADIPFLVAEVERLRVVLKNEGLSDDFEPGDQWEFDR